MKTPITDTLWKSGPAALEMLEHARRLELDRAALMEALVNMVESYQYEASMENPALLEARAALSAARANFSEP